MSHCKQPAARLAATLFVTALLASPAHAQADRPAFYAYRIAKGQPYAINAGGQVVGHDGDLRRGFVTGANGKGLTYLGTLLGGYSIARDVNAQGQVVGESDSQAFITDADGQNMRVVAPPVSDYVQAYARSVNDSGQVAGIYRIPGDGYVKFRAFVTGPGAQNPRPLAGFNPELTSVEGINNLGQVVGGSAFTDGSPSRAFVTLPNDVAIVAIDPQPAATVNAYAINDAGQLGGTAIYPPKYPGHVSHPFISEPGGPIEIKRNLGGETGHLRGINSHGDHVGVAEERLGQSKAYVAVRHGKPTRLDRLVVNLKPRVDLNIAMDINDARQIAALGSDGYTYIVCPTVNCE